MPAVSLSGLFNLQNFTDAGLPAANYRLYTYAPGTTTQKVAYTEPTGTTSQTYVSDGLGGVYIALNSRGELPAPLFLQAGGYDITLKTPAGASVWTRRAIGIADQSSTLAADLANTSDTAKGADLVGYRGRSVFDRLEDVVHSGDYSTLQAGLTAAAGGVFRVTEGTHTITAALTPSDNTTIILDAGAVITTSTPNITHIYINAKANVKVIGPGKLQRTAAGTNAYYAGVHIKSSDNCEVSGVQFVGMQWAGVWLDSATNCSIKKNVFTAALGTVQDAADVMVYELSYNNTIEGNWCTSGNHSGVLVQDPYASKLPKRNKIRGNWVVGHTAYGIALYLPATGDTYNEVSGNYIQNIAGSYASNRSSGIGIYVVGAGAGGTSIVNNTIIQCCISTLDRALAPGGIGINGIASGAVKPIVEGNTIAEMDQGDGIVITSCPGGVTVGPNTVSIPSTNNGSGAGGATLIGSGLRIEASNGVNVTGGGYAVAGSGYGCLIYANGSTLADIIVTGGYYSSVSAYGIAVTKSAAETINNIQLNTARVTVTGTTTGGVFLNGVTDGTVVGITVRSNTQPALVHNASTGIRYSGCSFNSSSGAIISTAGTCTNSLMDASNHWTATTSKMDNSGTGFRVEWYGASAIPAAGTWAVGDRAIRVPSIGQPKAWVCTTAGTPGTHTSEGNL